MKKSQLIKIIKEEITNELFGFGKGKNIKYTGRDNEWDEDIVKGKKLTPEQQSSKNAVVEALGKTNQELPGANTLEVKVVKLLDNGLDINYRISSDNTLGRAKTPQQTLKERLDDVKKFQKILEKNSGVEVKTTHKKVSTGTFDSIIFDSTITSK